MEGTECRVRLVVKIRLRMYQLIFLGLLVAWKNLIDHKHTRNHPELLSRQKVEYPVEILQLSVGSHHNIVTASKAKTKAMFQNNRNTYKCVESIAVVAVIYFFADGIALCMLTTTVTRRFAVVRVIASDNDALVCALCSEFASGTSGKSCAVETRRAASGSVQGHRHRESEGEMTEEVLIYSYVIT